MNQNSMRIFFPLFKTGIIILAIFFICSIASAVTPKHVFKLAGGGIWETIEKNIKDTRTKAGYSPGTQVVDGVEKTQLEILISDTIKVILSFIGTIFLILIIWGGYLWMTAGGNDEQVGKAKDIMKNGVLGLAIILGAYILTDFAVGFVISVTGV